MKLHTNCNLLYFIRKTLEFNTKAKEPKAFLTIVSSLKDLAPWEVPNWTLKVHDLALLKLVSAHGMFFADSTKSKKLLEGDETLKAVAKILIDNGLEKLENRVKDVCNRCWYEINFKTNAKKTVKQANEGFELFAQDGLSNNLQGLNPMKRLKTEKDSADAADKKAVK